MLDCRLLANTGAQSVIPSEQLPPRTIPQYASTTTVMGSNPNELPKRTSKKKYSGWNGSDADKRKDEKKQPPQAPEEEAPRPNESQDRQGRCACVVL